MTLDLVESERTLQLHPSLNEAAARQYEDLGHTAVRTVFDQAQAQAVLAQLSRRLFKTHLMEGTRVETATLKGLPSPSRDTAFDCIFGLINACAADLGTGFEADDGYTTQVQVLYARPGAHGQRHTDDRCDLTAITNLTGDSSLWIEGDLIYPLAVGDVVFIRGQELVHQGLADGPQPRTGLVIGKVPSVSLTPKTG